MSSWDQLFLFWKPRTPKGTHCHLWRQLAMFMVLHPIGRNSVLSLWPFFILSSLLHQIQVKAHQTLLFVLKVARESKRSEFFIDQSMRSASQSRLRKSLLKIQSITFMNLNIGNLDSLIIYQFPIFNNIQSQTPLSNLTHYLYRH